MTQPPMTPGYQVPPQPQPGSGLAIASLVTGIVAVVLFCVPILPWLLAITAIILGVIAISQGGPTSPSKGKAKAGVILGIISIVLSIALIITGGFLFKKGGQSFQQKVAEIQKQAEDAQKKAAEQQQKMQNQTQPSSSIPRPMEWRLASDFDGLPDRVVMLRMSSQA